MNDFCVDNAYENIYDYSLFCDFYVRTQNNLLLTSPNAMIEASAMATGNFSHNWS